MSLIYNMHVTLYINGVTLMVMAKILVDIVTPNETITKKCKIEGNHVIIRENKKNKSVPPYRIKFDRENIFPYKIKLFNLIPTGLLKQKLMLIDGADKFCKVNYDQKEINAPLWDRQAEENLFDVSVVKASGNITSKIELPLLMYLLIFSTVILSLLSILVSGGKIKI